MVEGKERKRQISLMMNSFCKCRKKGDSIGNGLKNDFVAALPFLNRERIFSPLSVFFFYSFSAALCGKSGREGSGDTKDSKIPTMRQRAEHTPGGIVVTMQKNDFSVQKTVF